MFFFLLFQLTRTHSWMATHCKHPFLNEFFAVSVSSNGRSSSHQNKHCNMQWWWWWLLLLLCTGHSYFCLLLFKRIKKKKTFVQTTIELKRSKKCINVERIARARAKRLAHLLLLRSIDWTTNSNYEMRFDSQFPNTNSCIRNWKLKKWSRSQSNQNTQQQQTNSRRSINIFNAHMRSATGNNQTQ